MPETDIVLKVDNSSISIHGTFKGAIYKEFKKVLGYEPPDAAFAMQQNPHWDGFVTTVCYNRKYCKCAVKKDGIHFPTGLYSLATRFFRNKGVTYRVIDERNKDIANAVGELGLSFTDKIKPYDYQQNAVEGLLKSQRGIIQVATGGGKTLIAAKMIQELSVKPTIFYVPSIDLLNQAHSEFSKFLFDKNGNQLKIGKIGGGTVDIQDVNVMTLQTAVRTLGEKYKKFDEEEIEDTTDISSDKDKIAELIATAKFILVDECHHARSETCQLICDSSVDARWRIGLSATPYRDEQDDILIEACFGKPIVKVNASDLIDRGILVPPKIAFVHVDNLKGERLGAWPTTYKMAVVENDYRNELISNLAENIEKKGRNVLLLVQQIRHGEILEGMIPGSVFIHGSTVKKAREQRIQDMKNGVPGVTIASSLPKDELIYIKENGLVSQVEIGEFCKTRDRDVIEGHIEALCSDDGKNLHWRRIIQTHVKRRDPRLKIVEVVTNKNETCIVTDNHSLVDCDLNEVAPAEGGSASCPVGRIQAGEIITSINTCILLKEINDPKLELIIQGLSQGRIRTLKKVFNYLQNPRSVCKSTRWKFKKLGYDKTWLKPLESLFSNVQYYKKRYRCKLLDISDDQILQLMDKFEVGVITRRSRKNIVIPGTIDVDENLGCILGILAGDGHVKKQVGEKCKSVYNFCLTALENIRDSKESQHDEDKLNIREIFDELMYKVFGIRGRKCKKHVSFTGKLLNQFVLSLGFSDSNGSKKVPDVIYNSHDSVKEAFLWGLYLAYESKKLRYKDRVDSNSFTNISICNTSRSLISGCCILCKMLNKKHSLHYILEENSKRSKRNMFILNIFEKIGPLVPTREVNRHHPSDAPQRFQKSVRDLNRHDDEVFDISVEGCENFVCGVGSILAHNTIADEGLDCKPLDALILAGGGKSSTRALQRIGRVIRKYTNPNGVPKKDALVYDIYDHQKYLTKHAEKRRKIYKTESRFQITDVHP